MWTWSLGKCGTFSDHAGQQTTDGGNLVHINLGLRDLTLSPRVQHPCVFAFNCKHRIRLSVSSTALQVSGRKIKTELHNSNCPYQSHYYMGLFVLQEYMKKLMQVLVVKYSPL